MDQHRWQTDDPNEFDETDFAILLSKIRAQMKALAAVVNAEGWTELNCGAGMMIGITLDYLRPLLTTRETPVDLMEDFSELDGWNQYMADAANSPQ